MKPSAFFWGVGPLIALHGCNVGCSNDVGATFESPRGDRIAVVFYRNCGATTGFNTQLSVLVRGTTPLNEAGNAFIADGTLPLEVRWKSESELVVTGYQGAKLFKQEKFANGVAISYE